MKFEFTLKTLALALIVATAPLAAPVHAGTATQAVVQLSYAAPEDAAKALAEAIRSEDRQAVLAVVGPQAAKWLSSGDAVADRADRAKFLAAYERKHGITPLADGRAQLVVGDDDWAFPAPLVKRATGWVFDAVAGGEEIANRRIGRNELDTIQTLLAIVDAQREYAAGDPDGNGFNDYAQRFVSKEGKKDGLYWPTTEGQAASPLGPLIAQASKEGYFKRVGNAQPAPYHGYRYRILTAQGKHAAGGQYDYMVNGKLIGGFAVLAYPVKYGASGVMSFIVNHDGKVYQKNLGQATDKEAAAIRRFDPAPGWKPAQ